MRQILLVWAGVIDELKFLLYYRPFMPHNYIARTLSCINISQYGGEH